MQQDIFISLSDYCGKRVDIGDSATIRLHSDSTNCQHKKIRMSVLQDKQKSVNAKIQTVVSVLVRLKGLVEDTSKRLLKQLTAISQRTVDKIQAILKDIWSPSFELQFEKNTVVQQFKLKQYKELTCKQMRKIVNFLQTVQKDQDYQKNEKPRMDKISNDILQQFDNAVKSKFQKTFVDFHQAISNKNASFSHSLSAIEQNSIVQEDNSTYSFLKQMQQAEQQNILTKQPSILQIQQSILVQQSESEIMKKKKKKYVQINEPQGSSKVQSVLTSKNSRQDDSAFKRKQSNLSSKVKQSNRGEASNNEKSNLSQINSGELSSYLKSQYFEEQRQNQQDTKTVFSNKRQQTTNRTEQQENISSQDEDSDQLNKTLIEIKQQIFSKKESDCKDYQSWRTIAQISKNVAEGVVFDAKVRIVKVLYFSVLQQHIPKIKFVAADHTGYAVFFTNYCQGMKKQTQLELKECNFRIYKGSAEITNHTNFRIMGTHESKITPNLKGVKLCKALTFDLHYSIQDKRCFLIRQIAQQLKKNKTVNIFRMTVEIVSISCRWTHGVFCLVGDSSGMMMAYIKKGQLKALKQGVVVRLINVKGERGKEKNNQMKQQILYIDTYTESSKVLPHGFDFLQLCSDVMCP